MSSSSLVSGVLTPNLSGASTDAKSKDSPEKIRDAATQFESLLISEVLKTAHEGDGEGWLGTGEDQTASSALGLADQFLAQTVAKNGGFGLARMISAGLAKRVAAE